MSHNSIKIGSKTPDVTGNITNIELSDLSDVARSPSDGQFLAYDSVASQWQPTNSSGVSNTVEYFLWGQGESEDYAFSPETNSSLGVGGFIYLYDTAPINGITGLTYTSFASSGTGSGSGEWLKLIYIPAGTYRINFSVLPSFSSSGYFGFAVRINGGSLITNRAGIGTQSTFLASGGGNATGIYTFSSTTLIYPYITTRSGTDSVANLGDSMSTSGMLLIEKLA